MVNMKYTIDKNEINILEQTILEYIQKPEDAELNFNVALVYENLGQWAAALSHFLRAAERTKNKNLAYECIIKIGLSFDRTKNRGNSVRGQYKQALLINPRRPEAYFLLARHYEREQDYVSAYTWACLGEQFADIDAPPLRSWIEYPGRYGIKFEKAVAGWWWGREKESRILFRELAEEYHGKMDHPHTTAVYNNINNLGIGREEITHKKYKDDMWPKLRYQFKGSDAIKQTHGQVYQDLFVLACLDGKRNGRYLEIGSAGPYYGNNTALLEEQFNWYGLGIDFDEKFVKDYREKRKNPILQANALEVDYTSLLNELAIDGVVDYLQLDCEPSSVTFDIMKKIPFDEFKFAVITYEHDHYLDQTKSYRQRSRNFLTNLGYELVVSDVSPEGHSSFEDWYVHSDLIDRRIIDLMRDIIPGDKTTSIRTIDDYMFPKSTPQRFDNFDWRTPKNNIKKEYWKRTHWPTLEITTNIAEKGCVVDCVFCPQRILEKSYTSDKRILTLNNFKFMIDKVPSEVRITFAGFTEPWLNKYCTDMALYAYEKGHKISAFTTAVGMMPEDVERLSVIPFAGNPNGGFCLHLPDQQEFAKHPINANYIRTVEKFKELQPKFRNFYTMCMSENVHELVRHIFPTASVPTFWNRAGNLIGEAKLKPELDRIKERWKSAQESKTPKTCGCIEDLYHNVLLPNGDVSLCCMDYSLEYILGNLNTQDYDDIVPVPNTTYDMCRRCENGVNPKNVRI
jgi:tetratricopeptide (TPR) repeat protein